jgi:hypothetical protein
LKNKAVYQVLGSTAVVAVGPAAVVSYSAVYAPEGRGADGVDAMA